MRRNEAAFYGLGRAISPVPTGANWKIIGEQYCGEYGSSQSIECTLQSRKGNLVDAAFKGTDA